VTRVVLLILLSLAVLTPPAPAEEKPLPAGLDLEVSMVASSGEAAPAPPLVTVTVAAEGEPIEELLRSQRIRPNGDALAVVYLLNPGLASVDPLPSGATLTLPSVPAAEAARLPPGSLVALSLAPKIKREILASDFSLGPIVERVNLLPAARFAGPDEKEEVVGALDEIRGFLDLLNTGITGGKLPLPPEVLRQSLVEARLVKAILEAFVKSGKPLGDADRETIVQISEDMNLKAASFDEMRRGGDRPRRWRDARVVIRVKGKEDGAPVSGLRVYYVPRALAGRREEVREVPAPDSTVALQLPEASYLVWAGTAADRKPLSPQARVDVRRQEGEREVVVDLPVPRGGGAR
jgi:phage tail protein X